MAEPRRYWKLLAVLVIVAEGSGCASGSESRPEDAHGVMVDAAAQVDGAGLEPDAGVGLSGFKAQLCKPPQNVGSVNPAGTNLAPTGVYSYWYWPIPEDGLSSLEWSLGIEVEPMVDGYFWSHQFGFAGPDADGGYMGIQYNGEFVADPGGPIEFTRMAVFSIAGGALRAELGDVAYPNAQKFGNFDNGDGWSIHVKYEWQACRPYLLRVRREGGDGVGNLWIGGTIVDSVTGVETYLGRILVPGSWLGLGTASVMWTERFNGPQMATCAAQDYASALFSVPTADNGTIVPVDTADAFYDPPACPTSRLARQPGVVRQEMGL